VKHRRVRSFRLQLLAATAVTAVVGLLGANLAVATMQHRNVQASDAGKARSAARTIAHAIATGTPLDDLRIVQQVLPNDQIVVREHGRIVFAEPELPDDPDRAATATFPGGTVTVYRSETSLPGVSEGEITLVFALVVALVLLVAAAVSTLLARRVRTPLERAIGVARRVAQGDYSARLGSIGLEEFADFGRAFDAMAVRLEQSDLHQRRFLADIAHELATPVNALVGFATALADGTASTPDEQAEAAVLIAQESARLRTLLRDLADLTRIDLFESVHPEVLRLDRFAGEMAARLRPLVEGADLELELDLEPVEAVADPRILESVVRNLLANAIRYTPAGGRVGVSTRAAGEEAVLAVRDTGIGIPPEHQARVFDRLYRADEARARTSGGSGLGLAIAQRAAAALGGRIDLTSVPGEGSTFRIVLPRGAHTRLRGLIGVVRPHA
jgi:two-component system sensor histidine kinase BaeS